MSVSCRSTPSSARGRQSARRPAAPSRARALPGLVTPGSRGRCSASSRPAGSGCCAAARGRAPGRLRSEDLRPRGRSAEFAAPGPGWQRARYHSPDLLIAAASVEAIRRGDYQIVMGEIHLAVNTLDRGVFLSQHPHPERLRADIDADLPEPPSSRCCPRCGSREAAGEPRLLAAGRHRPGGRAVRSAKDFYLDFSLDPPASASAQVLPIGELVVEPGGGGLVVGPRDGQRALRHHRFLSARVMSAGDRAFRVLSARAPTCPRVTVDRLVLARESWTFPAAALGFARDVRTAAERFAAARRWAAGHGMPRFLFAKTPSEIKPFYVDLESPVLRRELRQGRPRGRGQARRHDHASPRCSPGPTTPGCRTPRATATRASCAWWPSTVAIRSRRRRRLRGGGEDIVMEALARDVRLAARVLARTPGFTAAAVLCLGLGIGATSAVFSVVEAVLLRALPYEEPERLVTVWGQGEDGELRPVSVPEFQDLSEQRGVFAGVGLAFANFSNLTGDGEPERVTVGKVSANFFSLLGVPTQLGRTFEPEEGTAGNHRVAVLSAGLWRRRFGADPGILGRRLTLGDEPYTVVGVLPDGFRYERLPEEPGLWAPAVFDPAKTPPRDFRNFGSPGAPRPWRHARARPGRAGGPRPPFPRRLPAVLPRQGVADPAHPPQGESGGGGACHSPGAPSGGRPAAPDRLLERRQPAARAGRGARQGGGAAHRHRRQPWQPGAPVPGRGPGARRSAAGRSGSSSPGGDVACLGRPRPGEAAAHRRDRARRRERRLHRRPRALDRRPRSASCRLCAPRGRRLRRRSGRGARPRGWAAAAIACAARWWWWRSALAVVVLVGGPGWWRGASCASLGEDPASVPAASSPSRSSPTGGPLPG